MTPEQAEDLLDYPVTDEDASIAELFAHLDSSRDATRTVLDNLGRHHRAVRERFSTLRAERDRLATLVEILQAEQPDGEEYDAAERAVIEAWPDLGSDRVYVEQLVRHALDAAWAVNHKRRADAGATPTGTVTTAVPAVDDTALAAGEWVILEQFGHRRLAGYATEATIAGQPFVRLDIPAAKTEPARTQYLAPKSLYAVHPVDEAAARATAAAVTAPMPVSRWELERGADRDDEGLGGDGPF